MTEQAQYTAEELKAMKESLVRGEMPAGPRDSAKMTERPIGGGSFGLGYARKREWLICPKCRRSAIFDTKRGTRT
jgi:hypothetical protein